MKDFIIYIFLLCIYHSVLFFGKDLGINVLLFILPLLLLILLLLDHNNKIKNKKGLWLLIPIIMLSSSYLLYDFTIFNVFNIMVLPILFVLLFVFTLNDKVKLVIPEACKVIIYPFANIANLYRLLNTKISKLLHIKKNTWYKILSVLVVIPVILLILMLLSSADMIFGHYVSNFFSIFKHLHPENLLGRLIRIFILFTYLGAVLNYVVFNYKKSKIEATNMKISPFLFKVLLTSLNVIYLVFTIIQIKSLMLHSISMNISYAEYARQGFFQLMFISIINFIILFLARYSKDNRYNKVMSIIMILFTFVIILSSTYRMFMYEDAYGYTLLRLLVYITLFTEIILLIPTILNVFKKINILRYYFIICLISYSCASVAPLNYIIANRNINRYYETEDIDLQYLMNESTDNIPKLLELYDNGDTKIRNDLSKYFIRLHSIKKKSDSFIEFNFSRANANRLLSFTEVKLNNKYNNKS